MNVLAEVAPAFVEMAHQIVWCSAATSETFAVIQLEPWQLRVFPGTVLMGQGGEVLNWGK